MNDNKEDMYITTSLQPLTTGKKVKKYIFKPFLIIFIILCILGALAYYVLFPLYMKYFFRNPKIVFEKALDEFEEVINSILPDTSNNIVSNGYTLSLDTNIDLLKEYSNTNISLIGNIDKNKKYLDTKLTYNTEEYNYYKRDKETYLLIDNKYMNYNNKYLDILYDFYDIDNYKLVNNLKETLKSKLEDKRLSYEDESIEICKETIDIVRYTLKLDTKDLNDLLKSIDIKYEIKGTNEILINIYMDGLNAVGLDLEINGFRLFYFYNYNEKIDLYIDLSDILKTNIKFNIFTNEDNIIIYSFNNSQLGTIKIKEDKDSVINLDYTFNLLKYNAKGNFILKGGLNSKLFFNLNMKDTYLKLELDNDVSYLYDFKDIKEEITEYNEENVNNLINNSTIYKLYSKINTEEEIPKEIEIEEITEES